jgi:4-hydroxymandelate oxidase
MIGEGAQPNQLLPSLSAYARAAQGSLPTDQAAYFLSGAGSESTLHRNTDDLGCVTIVPRALCPPRNGSTKLSLLGMNLQVPIMIAPMAYQMMLHQEGEVGLAAAAAAQGCGMILSAQASQPMEKVIRQAPDTSWMQLYWQVTREATLAFAQRAADAGYKALVLTIDAPVNGVRDAEIEAAFMVPGGISAVNLTEMPNPNFEPLDPIESMLFDRIAHVLPDWDDVAWLCAHAPLPVLLKGILNPMDAGLAAQVGAAGIIVSNHGGRALDGAPSTISVLPDIAAVVGGRLPLLMDSGIRRGVDVFRALALGADAVLVGRPLCHGLHIAGALGASHVLRLLRDELEVTMTLAGCATLDDITRDFVQLPSEATF